MESVEELAEPPSDHLDKGFGAIAPNEFDEILSQSHVGGHIGQKYSKNRLVLINHISSIYVIYCKFHRFVRQYQKLFKWKAPESDQEEIPFFDVDKAWEALLSLPSCQEFMLR